MAQRLQTLLDAPIIELDSIDSTNNYAMRIIDADTAQAGMTIVATEQTQGKGQRGRQWKDVPGESLLMSIICQPECPVDEQFVFNSAIAVAIADVLNEMYEHWDVSIKWPNDIIVNDKKAGGILIENILRGNNWSFSIIGLGLNIAQTAFPPDLPFATSLKITSGKLFEIDQIFYNIRKKILQKACFLPDREGVMNDFNNYLYRKDRMQTFTDGVREWKAIIKKAETNGSLCVQLPDGNILYYYHGLAQWKWE